MMAIEVFKRHENKYLIDESVCKDIEARCLEYMELDEYNKSNEFYSITNIYYDTKDNYLIRNSLAKPKYKEKLRIRAYGVPTSEDEKVYFEIKKKICGVGSKRRTKLTLNEAYKFADTAKKPEIKNYMNKQVLNEIEYVFKIYNLEPKVYLSYDRKAMFSRDNRDLRITFDRNIITRRYDLRLEAGSYGEELLEDGKVLIEVKAETNIPLWLSRLLSEYKIYKSNFSKYGNEYKKMLSKNKKAKGEISECMKQYPAQYLAQPQMVHQYL